MRIGWIQDGWLSSVVNGKVASCYVSFAAGGSNMQPCLGSWKKTLADWIAADIMYHEKGCGRGKGKEGVEGERD